MQAINSTTQLPEAKHTESHLLADKERRQMVRKKEKRKRNRNLIWSICSENFLFYCFFLSRTIGRKKQHKSNSFSFFLPSIFFLIIFLLVIYSFSIYCREYVILNMMIFIFILILIRCKLFIWNQTVKLMKLHQIMYTVGPYHRYERFEKLV